jgi:hypothetical protein
VLPYIYLIFGILLCHTKIGFAFNLLISHEVTALGLRKYYEMTVFCKSKFSLCLNYFSLNYTVGRDFVLLAILSECLFVIIL